MTVKKDRFWDFFASVPLAVVLLIILAATSIIGTLIPQNESYENYVREFGPSFTKVIEVLDLFDMYHSWWFIFLLTLFTVNLILCSLKRLPPVIDQIRNPKKILTEDFEKGLPLCDTIRKKGSPERWTEVVKEFLEKRYGAAYVEKLEDKNYLYFEKGKYSRLGVYITHLSIIIIMIGGLIGAFFGFRGFVNIPEGAAVDQVFLRGGRPPYKMDFVLRCDKFTLSYYPMGMVKEYRSDVTIIENGREVKKDYLIVNRPLSYKGLTFYQSSYGVIDRHAKVRVFVKSGQNKGKSFELDITDKFANIPFSNDYVKIIDHYPNLENLGPAMILQIAEDGGMPVNFPVYKNLPDNDMNPQSKYFFKYIDNEEHFYTGLQVTKDPGVWVVWIGCFMMMFGLYYSFFVVRKRVWARIFFEGDRTSITIAGHSPRSRMFEEEFAKILDDIKELKV